ncbi:hypothetical protein CTAYLR_007343 [Chrysophaeum taylorii]|uniref:Translocon-associated protein subunit alpha n=1 Tax=Chrysophaeum taylorii TaxID=2483200 RepID=A0AAD7XNW9_9STRA|nr:hypothetical protein CTAYLR_007343 [Chrysophaeum taylorii]
MRLLRTAMMMAMCAMADEDLVRSTVREAQDEQPDEVTEERRPRTRRSTHPLTDIPAPGDFATATPHLVSHEGLAWSVGDEVTLLCHFVHRLAKDVNVTGLMGSLNSPVNFNYYLQNFTFDAENYRAAAREDVTFDYTFKLADTLDPGKWQVAVTVYYEVGRMLFASTFFNETVTLAQPSSGFSLLWLLAIFLAAAISAFFFRDPLLAALGIQIQKKGTADAAAAKARAAEQQAAAAQAAANDESWTAHLDTGAKPARKPSKKASKTKKKN